MDHSCHLPRCRFATGFHPPIAVVMELRLVVGWKSRKHAEPMRTSVYFMPREKPTSAINATGVDVLDIKGIVGRFHPCGAKTGGLFSRLSPVARYKKFVAGKQTIWKITARGNASTSVFRKDFGKIQTLSARYCRLFIFSSVPIEIKHHFRDPHFFHPTPARDRFALRGRADLGHHRGGGLGYFQRSAQFAVTRL